MNYSLRNLKLTLNSLFTRGTIASNSLLSLTSLIAPFFSTAVLNIVLARLVDIETLGEILYALVFANLVTLLSSYGFETLVIREISQERYRVAEITSNLLLAKLIISLITVALVGAFIQMVDIPLREPNGLWLYVGAGLVNSFNQIINAIRKGQNDFVTEMKVCILRSSIFFFGTLIAVLIWSATTPLVGVVLLLSRIVTFIFAASVVAKELWERGRPYLWRPSLAVIRELLVVGFPFAMQVILSSAYFRLDTLILGALKDSSEVGFYQASMQIVSAVMMLPLALIQGHYPKLASAFSVPGSQSKSLVKRMMSTLVILGCSLMILLGLGAELLIPTLYGPKLRPSIAVLQILSPILLIRSVIGGLGISLIALGYHKVQALAGFAAVIVSLGLNLLIIPSGGFAAAAWTNVVANLVVLGIYYLWWRKALVKLTDATGPDRVAERQTGQFLPR